VGVFVCLTTLFSAWGPWGEEPSGDTGHMQRRRGRCHRGWELREAAPVRPASDAKSRVRGCLTGAAPAPRSQIALAAAGCVHGQAAPCGLAVRQVLAVAAAPH
jgi:hypothetical protein